MSFTGVLRTEEISKLSQDLECMRTAPRRQPFGMETPKNSYTNCKIGDSPHPKNKEPLSLKKKTQNKRQTKLKKSLSLKMTT